MTTLFGPTCDGLDTVAVGLPLPLLAPGDWLLWPNMGAYTLVPPPPPPLQASRRRRWPAHNRASCIVSHGSDTHGVVQAKTMRSCANCIEDGEMCGGRALHAKGQIRK